jgi:hypothetical protein
MICGAKRRVREYYHPAQSAKCEVWAGDRGAKPKNGRGCSSAQAMPHKRDSQTSANFNNPNRFN